MGSFNNYVDQILPNFDHLPHGFQELDLRAYPHRVGDRGYFKNYQLFFTWSNGGFLLTTYLPLIVHVVIERTLFITNTLRAPL